jgi:hypothetical protein
VKPGLIVLLSATICATLSSVAALADETEAALPLKGELAAPVEKEPTISQLDAAHGETWHRVSMRLSGSLCPACLLELQDKLRHLDGVGYARVEHKPSSPVPAEATSAEPKNAVKTVAAVVIYDDHAVEWAKLKKVVHANKYECLNVSDQTLLPIAK